MPNDEIEPGSVRDLSEEMIEKINSKIAPFDQKVEKYEYGLTNEEFVVFISSAATSISKMQNSYNEAELDFFKILMTKIFMNEELNITPRNALNLSSSILPKLNKLRVQKLLDIWTVTGYLYQHTDSQIYLGAKSLTEFKEFLQKMDLAYCGTCLLCENIACWVRIDTVFTVQFHD